MGSLKMGSASCAASFCLLFSFGNQGFLIFGLRGILVISSKSLLSSKPCKGKDLGFIGVGFTNADGCRSCWSVRKSWGIAYYQPSRHLPGEGVGLDQADHQADASIKLL